MPLNVRPCLPCALRGVRPFLRPFQYREEIVGIFQNNIGSCLRDGVCVLLACTDVSGGRSGLFRRENIRFRVAHGEAGADRDMEPSRRSEENVRAGFDKTSCDVTMASINRLRPSPANRLHSSSGVDTLPVAMPINTSQLLRLPNSSSTPGNDLISSGWACLKRRLILSWRISMVLSSVASGNTPFRISRRPLPFLRQLSRKPWATRPIS